MRTVAAIARNEIRALLRGRMIPGFAAAFAALALAITLGGLGASGQVLVQGYTRTAVSLLNLSLYVLPLLGLLLGATAIAVPDDGTELLLAQPVSRTAALLGRFVGLSAALAVVAGAGFGAGALLIGIRLGIADLAQYVMVALASTLVAVAAIGMGMLLGVSTGRRTAAVGSALTCWLAAAVLYDLVAIAIVQLGGAGEVGGRLLALLTLNPIDGVRTLALVTLEADVLLGPAGTALQTLLGGAGVILILGSLAGWLLVPLGAAAVLFHRRDF